MRHTAAIADDEQPLVARFQMLVQLDLHVVELDLHAVQQRVVIRRAGGDLVERVDHLNDAVQNTLGHDQAQIARRRRERGRDERLIQPLLRAALPADEVAEALHDHAAAEHIGKPRDGLAIAVAVLERLGKVLGHQQRKVRVLRLAGGVLIAVPVHGDDAVRVLIHDRALGVHAERAHEVLIFFGFVDDLALIQLVGDVLEHLRRQLHAHADVHAVGERGDLQLIADGLHPLAAAAPDGDDALRAGKRPLGREHLVAAVDFRNALDRRMEVEVHTVLQLAVQIPQHLKVDVGAQMPHRRVEQVEIIPQALGLKGGVGGGVELCLAAAVGDVDVVHIVHQLQRALLSDIAVQRAAKFVCDVIFAVRKRARTAKAVHNGAGLAVDAAFDLIAVNGAAALTQLAAAFQHGDLQAWGFVAELIGGKNAARTCADNEYIILHSVSSLLCSKSQVRIASSPSWLRGKVFSSSMVLFL